MKSRIEVLGDGVEDLTDFVSPQEKKHRSGGSAGRGQDGVGVGDSGWALRGSDESGQNRRSSGGSSVNDY